jgi:hypothetical protein
MPNRLSSKPPKGLLAALLLVVSIFLFAAKKIFDYASPPAKAKDCDFVFPAGADQTKPTSIMVESPVAPPAFTQLGGFINDASCLVLAGGLVGNWRNM